MKNRKTVVVAFLLVAVMLLGVGYAALTDVLTITGDLGAVTDVAQSEFDQDVYFSATSIATDDTNKQAASQILEGRDDAKITAKHFTTKGQKVVVKFTIQNDSPEFDALIEPVANAVTVTNADPSHSPIFSAKWEWDSEGSGITGAASIPVGESKDLYVTITLIETPTEEHTAEFTITYNATATQPVAAA